jgi:hypothetical protein
MIMSIPRETTSSEFIEEVIIGILVDAYGEIPSVRRDTPLLSLGFQPSHAVLLAYLAKVAGLAIPTDDSFESVVTVGDFATACLSGGSSG